MTSIIKSFYGRKIEVRVENKIMWFVAKDIAEALGYKKPRNAIRRHVKEREKRLVSMGGGPVTGP